jgi:hypothetical protein
LNLRAYLIEFPFVSTVDRGFLWLVPRHLPGAAENRHVADVALQLLTGAAYLARVRLLGLLGVELPAALRRYRPEKPLD